MASPDEINLFISETDGLMRKIEEEIINLDKDPENKKPVEQLFFVFNGLTRLITMINLKNASEFSKNIELMLEKAKNAGIPKNKFNQFINLMFGNFEILKSLIEFIKKGEIKDIQNVELNELQIKFENFESDYEITFIKRIPPNKINSIIKDKNFFQIFIRIKDTCKFKKVRLFFIFRALNNIGQICYSKPEPEDLEKGDLDFEFEIYFMTKREEKEISSILDEILEIENKFIKEITADKFKKIIIKFDSKLQQDKEEQIRKSIELKGSDADVESDFENTFFNPILPKEVDELRGDRKNIFYKIYIRLTLGCKFKKLRIFLIFRALSHRGRLCWSHPSPKQLEQGKFNFDFELFFISQKKKKEIHDGLDEIIEIGNKAINEITPEDFRNIVAKFVPKLQKEIKQEKKISMEDADKKDIFQEKMLDIEKKTQSLDKKAEKEHPKIIFTDDLKDMEKKIFLPPISFVKLIENDNHDIVFSCHQENDPNKFHLYVIKEGVCFATKEDEFQLLKDKFNIYDGGFTNFHEFLDANKFGVNDSVEYISFRTSEFYSADVKSYLEFLKVKKD